MNIVIIGAGIAGLAAANHLRQQNFNVTILEARNRIGGRIHIDYSWGFPLSKGASWIHDVIKNPMLDLARQYSSPLFRNDLGKSQTYTTNNKIISKDVKKVFDHSFEEALVQAKRYALNSQNDCSLAEAFQPFWKPDTNNANWQALFKRQLIVFENYIGDNYENLSARYWDLGGSLTDENYFVGDGYESIINGLAKDCKIYFNTCVEAIDYQQPKIKILTNKGEYTADKAIITLPLGVLKTNQVKFIPALPKIKQNAINKIGMGLFDIIGLKFSTVFWPEHITSMFIFNDESVKCNVFFNLQEVFKQPILFGYIGGSTARALETISDQKIITQTLDTLTNTFGPNIPNLEDFFITRWGSDCLSLGSYSYVAVGVTTEDFVTLGSPVDKKLYFAGEATNAHIYDATVHGAYLSGIREAERITAFE